MNFLPPRTSVRAAMLAFSLLLVSNFFATSAQAANPIEGVWSFNGGRIAIQEAKPGVFSGTVVAPTTFSFCAHPAGEEIWTQMAQQDDGSYWGDHQWFFESSDCTRNPAPGPTAWRVLQKAEGRYLRACFSEPGSNLQPTIAADGTSSNATFGCVDSALVSAVPVIDAESVDRYVKLPSTESCLSAQRLRIKIKNPVNDPFKKVTATASGGGVKVKAKVRKTKKGFIAVLKLRKIPGEKVVVKVRLTTILGQHLKTKQVYHRCGATGGQTGR